MVKNCVWKDKIETLLGTFSIDLSDAGEKTKNIVIAKISKKSATKQQNISSKIEPKPFVSKINLQKVQINEQKSNVIDIEMPKTFQKKSSSNIFSIKDPKYVEFVDELESKSKRKSSIFDAPDKMVQTINVTPNPQIIISQSAISKNLQSVQNPKINTQNLNVVIPSQRLSDHSLSQLLDIEPIIIKADYIKEPNAAFAVEKNIPDLKKYYPLGYDLPKNRLDPATTKKHYRLFLESILESSPYMDHHPFDEFIITRGKRAKSNSIMSKFLGLDEDPKALGLFKCFIEVLNEKDKFALEASKSKPLIDLFESEKGDSILSKPSKLKKIDIDKEFMQCNNVVIRVHILEVYNLIQLDSDSIPNPYIKVILGTQEKNVKIT